MEAKNLEACKINNLNKIFQQRKLRYYGHGNQHDYICKATNREDDSTWRLN